LLGLTRDFIQQGGTFMVLSRSNGIRSDELSKVEVSMISASRIPRFLPLYVKEIDLQVTLRYDITEKKMLSHMLKSEKINMTEYYGLLLQIAETLEESAKYMLQPGKYVLNEDYIFVDGSLQAGTLYLAYIPLERDGPAAVNNSLKELVTQFMASVTELSGGGVQQLLQYTASEGFTLGGFKRLLLRLMSSEDGAHTFPARDGKPAHAPVPYEEDPVAGVLGSDGHAGMNRGAQSQQRPEVFSSYKGKAERAIAGSYGDPMADQRIKRGRNSTVAEQFPVSITERSRGSDDHAIPNFLKGRNSYVDNAEEAESDEEEGQNSTSSRKIYIALGCLLASALVWRMIYMPVPSSGKLILCVLLTVVLGTVALMGWKGKLFAPKHADMSPSVFDELPDFGSAELSMENKRNKGRYRFEVEQFTGFFKGNLKKGNEGDRSAKEDSDPEPEWKWKFPPAGREQSIANSRESLSGGSVAAPEDRLNSVLNQRMWDHIGVTDTASPDMDESDYYGQLGMKTEILKPGKGGATVLLSNPAQDAGRPSSALSAPECYLLREGEEGARAEQIELRQQHFVIGRSDEVSQYVESSVGASRAHVELSRSENGGYLIKDLGSRNGTRLGGETMVPYKEYPLRDGDTFIIVKGRYTFRKA
jgi:hypothetical protein